jgi:hypothetical protein
MTAIKELLRRRNDVAAVLSILKIRAEAAKQDRQNIVMDDDNGKTWIGALVWGGISLWQDNPVFVIFGAAAAIAFLVRLIA